VWTRVHAEMDFSGDHHLFASCKLLKCPTYNLLASTARVDIAVSKKLMPL
jgi:hypothetical protein